MSLFISQKAPIYIYDYPYAEKINPILHRIILQTASIRDKGALMTEWNCNHIKEFKLISDYVLNLQNNFALPSHYLKLMNIWGQVYNIGDCQISHHHIPNHWSFVYYVNTPRRSSPIVFDDSRKRIRFKAGQVIIFPSWLIHHVPPNKCEGRVVIGGNLTYTTHRGIR